MQICGDHLLLRQSEAARFHGLDQDSIEFHDLVVRIAKQTSWRRRGPVRIECNGVLIVVINSMEDFK